MSAKQFFSSLTVQTLGGVLLKGSGVLLGLVASAVLARFLGPENLGVYVFCISLLQILMIPGSLGFHQLFVREVASYRQLQHFACMRGLLRSGFGLSFAVSIAISALLGVLTSVLVADPQMRTTLFISLPLLPAFCLILLASSGMKGFGRVLLGQCFEMLIVPGIFLLLVCGFWWFLGTHFSAEKAMGFQVVANGGGALLACLVLFLLASGVDSGKGTTYEVRMWVSSGMTFMLYFGLSALNNHLSVLVLGCYGLKSDVGFYQVASRGAELVIFGLVALGNSMAPRIASLYAEKKLNELQEQISRSSWYLNFYSVGITLFFFVFAERLIAFVYGVGFEEAIVPFQVLCFAQLLNALFGHAGLTLNMIGLERITMYCIVVGFLVNLVLNIILAPIYGALGSALAMAAGIVIWKLLATMALYRKANIRSGPFLVMDWLKFS